MGNVLSVEKREQVIALGRLGWSLRRTEEATGVRRETASAYLKAAGLAVRVPGQTGPPPKPATGVSTDSEPLDAKPARGVSTDSAAPRGPGPRPEPVSEHVRAVPRGDRDGARPRPQRDGDLAGPRRSPRLRRRLRERDALRAAAAAPPRPRGVRDDHDRPRRGGSGRLRRGP